MIESDALTAALRAEHAAIYAYGVLGSRLDEATRTKALTAYDAHRLLRDRLAAALRTRTLPVPGPATSYAVTVAGRPQALTLAVRVETELAVSWRDLVGATDEVALRRLAVAALQDCAVRATQWRVLARTTPLTTALPGTV